MIKFKPNILVILASYNGEKYIREQIISIINQKEVEINIHIFDDASDDETCQIAKEFPEVILTKRSHGSGSAAINFLEALFELKSENELIKYDYIAFADQDDIWLENKMSRSIYFLKKGYDLYGSNLTIYKNGFPTDETIVKSHKQKKYDFLFEGGSAGCTYVFTPYLAEIICDNYKKIRTKTWKYFSHDWFIYFIARLNGLKTHIDKESNIYYRIHENNVHGEMNSNSIKAYAKRVKFVFSNWYLESSKGYLQFCAKDSVEFKILNKFVFGYFQRIWVLIKFNTQLMKSKSKFCKFFVINALKIK
jgi:rhamnosyltransferase